MSDEQILAWYDHERDESNDPMFPKAAAAGPPSLRELHRRKCHALGVTEPEDVERDWKREQQRLADRRAARKKKQKR